MWFPRGWSPSDGLPFDELVLIAASWLKKAINGDIDAAGLFAERACHFDRFFRQPQIP
jgi:hypothetical protein